ncbi:MAG: hypothetical protein V7785_00955 [Bermanella sp.]
MTDKDKQATQAKKVSTTALAKLLNMDSKALFELLVTRKWITRTPNKETGKLDTALTKKGQFEGGEYLNSKKFGTYIVWPTRVTTHTIFTRLESKKLNASSLSKALFNSIASSMTSFAPDALAIAAIAPWRLNLILSELGWIVKTVKGWQLTQLGTALGGEELQHASTGLSYVVWPQSIIEQQQLVALLDGLYAKSNDDDLYVCLDGHQVAGDTLRQIDNWLYTAGLNHAVGRELPEVGHFCDFYLPQGQVYLEYWDYQYTGQQAQKVPESVWLKQKVARRALYEKLGLNVISLQASDLINNGKALSLDEILPKRLLQFNVQV